MSFHLNFADLVRWPPLTDEESARRARILRVISLSALVLSIMMAVAVYFFMSGPFESLVEIAVLIIWELTIALQVKRGHVRGASLVLTVGLAAIVLVTSYLFGGVRQIAFSSYVIVILTGGMLLGKRAVVILAALGVVGGAALLVVELLGALPQADLLDSSTTWAAASATFIWGAVVLYMALTSIDEELARRAEEVRKRREAQEQITRSHAEIEEHLHRLQALHMIDQAISSSQDLPTVLNVVLDQVVSHLHADAAAVLLSNGNNETLEVAGRTGFLTPDFRGRGQGISKRLCFSRAASQEGIRVRSLGKDASGFHLAPGFAKEHILGYFAAPFRTQNRIEGLLEVFTRTPLEPDSAWLDFMEALATQTAIAVDNAKLLEELQRSNDELTSSYDTTIEGWARALELRDGETEGHSRRVADGTVNLARRLGVRDSDLADLRRGALLHDIGKMGIPDTILLKPGPLEPPEWEIMRLHPGIAMHFLAPIPFLQPALDIPYCHHEKWDGSGYPRGLKDKEIPLGARVFAVVDVWDALCSDRPYRKAWPAKQARDYIESQAGEHFDPRVVQQFLEMVDTAENKSNGEQESTLAQAETQRSSHSQVSSSKLEAVSPLVQPRPSGD